MLLCFMFIRIIWSFFICFNMICMFSGTGVEFFEICLATSMLLSSVKFWWIQRTFSFPKLKQSCKIDCMWYLKIFKNAPIILYVTWWSKGIIYFKAPMFYGNSSLRPLHIQWNFKNQSENVTLRESGAKNFIFFTYRIFSWNVYFNKYYFSDKIFLNSLKIF